MGGPDHSADDTPGEASDTTQPSPPAAETPSRPRPRYRLSPDIPWLENETMLAPDQGYVIGAATIRDDLNRITFPSRVINAELVLPGDILYWGYETDLDLVVATPYRRDVEFCDRFEYVKHSSVSSQGVTTVPKQFFPDYQGPYQSADLADALKVPDTYQLQYGTPYFIVTSPLLLLRTKLFYLVSLPRALDLFGDAQTQVFAKQFELEDELAAVIQDD